MSETAQISVLKAKEEEIFEGEFKAHYEKDISVKLKVDSGYRPEKLDSGRFSLFAKIEETIIGMGRKVTLPYRHSAVINAGIKVEVPEGWKMCVSTSSFQSNRGVISINPPYFISGDLNIAILNCGRETVVINDKDEFAQCWLEPIIDFVWRDM